MSERKATGTDERTSRVTRRRFLTVAAASAAVLPAMAAAQSAPTKETLRGMVDAAELAITDEQLGKLAGAVSWGRGELRKLREVDAGLGGPAPVFLAAAPGGDDHE